MPGFAPTAVCILLTAKYQPMRSNIGSGATTYSEMDNRWRMEPKCRASRISTIEQIESISWQPFEHDEMRELLERLSALHLVSPGAERKLALPAAQHAPTLAANGSKKTNSIWNRGMVRQRFCQSFPRSDEGIRGCKDRRYRVPVQRTPLRQKGRRLFAEALHSGVAFV